MSFIRDDPVGLDTNVIVFGVRAENSLPECRNLLFDRLVELTIHLPLQVFIELQHRLSSSEMSEVQSLLSVAAHFQQDFAPAESDRVAFWESQGARRGDAVIDAQLEGKRVQFFISENRHFLREIRNLPFQVITSQEAINMLDE